MLFRSASGLYRGGDQRTLGDRISRETANLRRSQQMLARTLVQRSRLRAELEGNATFVAPIQLAKLVGAKLAKDLINAESAHLRKFAKMRTARTQNWARSSALALKKIANMRQQEKITRQQKLTVKKTINKYKARYQRTVVRASLRSQDMIVRLDLRQLELKSTESKIQAELLAAQQNTVKAERDYSSIILNETVKLKNRLERIENDIINFHSEISIARSLLGRIDKKDPRSSHSLFSEQILSYTLKRQGGVKNSSIKVNEDTRVRPGDILQVHVKK